MSLLHYGLNEISIDVPGDALVAVRARPIPPALSDPSAAVRAALENPLAFPALRRALTPDDRVTVVIDESLPRFVELLTPILEHITAVGIAASAITLLSAFSGSDARWLDELPEAFEEVTLASHDPKDPKNLAYLATTKSGRRIYLNRHVIDADQLVVLSRPDVDPLHGRGGVGLLFPNLGDQAEREEAAERLARGGADADVMRRESAEIAWLLGAPFLVQVIEDTGDTISAVVAGIVESSPEARGLYETRWRRTTTELADVVLATVSGDPRRHDFAGFARALANAAILVQPEGRIIVLSGASPRLGPGAELLRRTEEPAQALELLREQPAFEQFPALQWAQAAERGKVFLLSGLPAEVAEELFVTPLENAAQAVRLLRGARTCLLLEDADKVLPVFAPDEDFPDE